jgi:hypothetical protein
MCKEVNSKIVFTIFSRCWKRHNPCFIVKFGSKPSKLVLELKASDVAFLKYILKLFTACKKVTYSGRDI